MDIPHIPGDRDFRIDASVVAYVDLASSEGEPLNSSIPMDVEDVDGRSSARKRPASGQASSPDIFPNKVEGNNSDKPAKKKDKKFDSAPTMGESRTGPSGVDTSAGIIRSVNTEKGRFFKECDNNVVNNNKVVHSNSPSVSTVKVQNTSDKNHNRKNCMKYSAKDCAPFIVYIYSGNGEGAKPAHPLHISRLVTDMFRDSNAIIEIKKIGLGKVMVELSSYAAANRLVDSQLMRSYKYSAFISAYRMMRAGIIRDVPVDWDEETVRKAISSPCNILEVRRIN